MNINATLLVQAGNFFIAYLLFRYILLKPACAIITQENLYNDSLQEQLQHGHDQIKEKQALQQKKWLNVHLFYKKNQPLLPDLQTLFYGICPPASFESFSDKEIDDVAAQLAPLIVSRVEGRS